MMGLECHSLHSHNLPFNGYFQHDTVTKQKVIPNWFHEHDIEFSIVFPVTKSEFNRRPMGLFPTSCGIHALKKVFCFKSKMGHCNNDILNVSGKCICSNAIYLCLQCPCINIHKGEESLYTLYSFKICQ